jgi:hypothetical protein
MDNEYLHVYHINTGLALAGGFNEPPEMTHTKVKILKTTKKMIHVEGAAIYKDKLNTVAFPECDTIYMLTPDNELARHLFTEWIDKQIKYCEEDIARFKQIKQVVEGFKD